MANNGANDVLRSRSPRYFLSDPNLDPNHATRSWIATIIAITNPNLFQPKKVSVLAGEGGQSSSNKRRRKIKETKETTRVFLHEKSKKHTNDVNDKDLFSLQQSKLLFEISHLRLINLQNSKF